MGFRTLIVCCFMGLPFLAAPARASDVGSHAVLAQAGSAGGTLGKRNKSASGGEEERPSPKKKVVRRSSTNESASRTTKAGKCPNIVGVWNSWASGLFGSGDTTFNADGTAIHRSGIPGKWKCDGGKLMISWGGEAFAEFKLDSNKLVNSDGGVGFSR